MGKGEGHWVNGVEGPIRTKQENNQKNHNTTTPNQTIKPTQENKNTPDGVGEKNGDEWREKKNGQRWA